VRARRALLLAALGGGAGGVADVAVRAEVVRQPAEADAAAEADVAVGRQPLRDVALRPRHVDALGSEVEHQRRLVDAGVHPHPQLALRGGAALVDWEAGMGEERHQAVLEPQFAVGHVEQRRVAAVPVDEHELARRQHGDAAADVVEDGEQRRRRQPHGAGRPGVLVRLRVGEGRQQPSVVGIAVFGDGGLGDLAGDHEVGVEREVRPVLLDGTEGLQHDRAGGQALGYLRGPQLGQPSRHGRQPTTPRFHACLTTSQVAQQA